MDYWQFDISGILELWLGARTVWAKSIGLPISDFGCLTFFKPHSAIDIPQFRGPPGPQNGSRLMLLAS
jgi:hypothetical protein